MTTFTAAEVLAILAAIVTVVGAISLAVVNVVVALKQGTKLDTALAKTDGLVHQVAEVHTLTNSNLSAVKADLASAAAQIQALRDVVYDLKSERSKAALTTALHTTVGPGAHEATLDQIERNTSDTVAELKKES